MIKRSEGGNPSLAGGSSSSFSVSSALPGVPSGNVSTLPIEDQPGSPELAKISALITRPHKPPQQHHKDRNNVAHLPSVGQSGSPSFMPPPLSKVMDVVSIPTLKIKEFKTPAKDREYVNSVAGGSGVGLPTDAEAAQVVPPLKIKNNPFDDKTGNSLQGFF